jgi:hypothetical protein
VSWLPLSPPFTLKQGYQYDACMTVVVCCALALSWVQCITWRPGPHDTPVIDGRTADGGRE